MHLQRFLSKFKEGSNDECWNWTAGTDKDGYGLFLGETVTVRAHRYSYEHHIGKIPSGMYVCHRCDNTSCVNPTHLFLGSAQDNMDDKISKGRLVVGTGVRNRHAKLTEADVLAIRAAHASGSSTKDLAEDYDVYVGTIGAIIRRTSWKHI